MALTNNVSAVQASTGELRLKYDPQGRWHADNATAFAEALVRSGLPVSGWSCWIDGQAPRGLAVRKGEVIASAKLAKLVETASLVELVGVRRPWPQPKLKLSFGTAKAAKAAAGKGVVI